MKARRQIKIHELIRTHAVETQDELARLLKAEGIEVTQATVSRDIKELRLVKLPTGDGRYRYSPPADSGGGDKDQLEKLHRYMVDAAISLDYTKNLVLVKCLPGTANAIAVILDRIQWSEVVGSIAGDDTILLVTRDDSQVEGLVTKLRNMMR
ncbi:MAG: arginine repressor [Firmicutes bacterium RBG_13_65_8]|nr:MAG: arginine repressor [Firmicutes bacterium RBG_13_65_8]